MGRVNDTWKTLTVHTERTTVDIEENRMTINRNNRWKEKKNLEHDGCIVRPVGPTYKNGDTTYMKKMPPPLLMGRIGRRYIDLIHISIHLYLSLSFCVRV